MLKKKSFTDSLFLTVVLNLKKGGICYELKPELDVLMLKGITTRQLAYNLRWMIYGSVADKWFENGNEIVIHVRAKDYLFASKNQVENLYLAVEHDAVKIKTLGQIIEKEDPGKIFRKNLRRCAYFIVESSKYSLDKTLTMLKHELNKLDLPSGYGFSFEREVVYPVSLQPV